MDPISALGAAAAAVQFLDFTARLLSATYDGFKGLRGQSSSQDLNAITLDIQLLNTRIAGHSQNFADEDDDIEKLCSACNTVAAELLGVLEKRTVKHPKHPWKSFRAALSSVWNEGEIESLRQRIDGYRQEISMHMIVHIRCVCDYFG